MTEQNKKVLILGGTGFLGYYVINELEDKGFDLGVLVRRKKDDVKIPTTGYKLYKGNILNKESLEKAMKDFRPDVVVDMVGVLRRKSSLPAPLASASPVRATAGGRQAGEASFKKVYIEGTRNIVEASKGSGVEKLIFVSVHGASENGPTEYFRAKAKAENIIQSSGLNWTILRPSMMFGWRSGFSNTLIKMADRLPFFPKIGRGKHQVQPVAAPVVASAIAQAIDREDVNNKAYEVLGPETLTLEQISKRLREATKTGKPIMGVPVWLLKLSASLFGERPVTQTQLHMLMQRNIGDVSGDFARDFDVKDMYFDPFGEITLY